MSCFLNYQNPQDQENHPAEELESEIELLSGDPIAEVAELLPTTVRLCHGSIWILLTLGCRDHIYDQRGRVAPVPRLSSVNGLMWWILTNR